MQHFRISRKTLTHALALVALGAAAVVGLDRLRAQEVIIRADIQPAVPPAAATTTTSPSELPDPPKPATQPNDRAPGGLMDRAADSGAQVYVDDSFASVEKLRVALRYASQNRSQEAINAFQEIIDKFGQKLVYLNNDSYVSITDYVREKLLGMPDVQKGMYDQIFGAQVEKEVATAIEGHDLSGLIRTCDRYFCAAASQKGLLLAADWFFERGEFSSASRVWQLLLSHPKSRGMQANLLFRAAVAEKLAGNEVAAKKLRDRVAKDFSEATGTVDGQTTNLLAAADRILKGAAWERATLAADEWPMFQGNASRSGLLDVNSSAGARLWGVDLSDEAIRGIPKNNRMLPPGVGPGFRGGRSVPLPTGETALSSHPIISSGTLYVHTGDRLVALSANAGTLLWAFPTQVIPRMDAAMLQAYQNSGQAYRRVSHDAAAVYGDQVFAVLPASPGPSQVPSGRGYYYGGMPMGNTRVVALNRNGAQLWERAAHTVKTDAKGSLVFVGSPLVTRQGVYVMGSKQGDGAFTQVYLVRLDRETGEVTWSCYLCSASTGGYYGYNMMPSNVAVPTLADEVVYISTGQGADCAVDANAGRILWLQITESAKKLRNPEEMYRPMVTEASPSWKFDPPQVYGDKLITHETGGNLRVYDRWNGRLIRSIARKDLENMEVMAGILDHQLLLVGNKIVALDLDKIDQSVTTTWTVSGPESKESGKLQGRPFLAASVLYVPYMNGLMMVEPKRQQMSFSYWPKNEKDENGKPGNILVTTEQIIVVNDAEIAGYSRWETARDNRLARIRENPANPEPYLALGEIAFRTNHFDLAEENIKKAVELATSPQGAGANGDLLTRLYHTNLTFAEQLLVKTERPAPEGPLLRDRARFYYEQCKLAARDVEQQAEWRLCMAQLSLAQKKPEEAAALYNEVLTDSALRTAPYRRGDALARAGVTAEMSFGELVKNYTPAVYKRYEDQAVALLAKARTGKDVAGLDQVVSAYPNSNAALDAATDLAAAYRDQGDFANQVKTLRWLYTRISGKRKGRVTADLAVAHLGLKRFAAAASWAQRGLRQYKDLSWPEPGTGQTMTFAMLNDRLRAAGATIAEGRLPVLPPPVVAKAGEPAKPQMDDDSVGKGIAGTLMAPIEQTAALRRPDKLFVNSGGRIRIFDAATMSELTAGKTVELSDKVPSAMLGHSGDIAVIVQAKAVLGLNVRTQTIAWTVPLRASVEDLARQYELKNRQYQIAAQQAQQAGQPVYNNMVFLENPETYNTNPYYQSIIASLDGDQARAFAFAQLGRAGQRDVAFSTMRLINNKIVVVVNGELAAYDAATGRPAWKDKAGNAVTMKLPEGYAGNIVGNEDLIVVQVDSGDQATPTFYVVEADTGKFRRQIKLDDERAQWRTLSEDGTLFVVTDQAVCAYDLFNDQERPLWRRQDIRTRNPAATALTIDGLVLVSASNDLICLSLEGGEARWPRPSSAPIRLELPASQGQVPFLHCYVDGETIIYQSNEGIVAYYSNPQDDVQLAWKAIFTPGRTPPLSNLQLSDPYAVVLASGQLGGVQRAVSLFFLTHNGGKGGKRSLEKELVISQDANADKEGPLVRNWQVLDNGVALEARANVYFFRGKKGP